MTDGETSRRWYDDNALQRLATMLADRTATLGRSRLVAVDGPAGSGKTTLATELQSVLASGGTEPPVLHMDDLYEGWDGLDDSLERRVVAQVLAPVAQGRAAAWQRFDWHRERFAEWHDLAPPEVLILEGCGSGARAYAAYTTLLVWVEADREERIARGITRDGEQMRHHWMRWTRSEADHFAANHTQARADIAIRTS